ncbi:MAG: glycosyltransferase [Solirubrobacterales bacterium]
MSGGSELVLLTSAYPFGNAAETFLETEIEVLAERFRRVYVLPSHREPRARPLPANVELVEMDWFYTPSRRARQRALVSPEATSVFLATVRSGASLGSYLRASRFYLDNLARNVRKYRLLSGFVRDRGLADAIFYDYWFENSTLALALLRESGTIRTAVSRIHGFDLYDERWSVGTVPFREVKARALDAIFSVSEFGREYLGKRIPKLQEKVSVQRLGVSDPGHACPAPTSATPLVVTCARLEAQKCVHLVPEVLARLRRPVRWVHFGDGPERSRVAEEASRLLNGEGQTVKWELRGQVDNREVLDFYEGNHVDALLSLSASEGLPVSMMEAQSYGVPVVARGVGAVPEIVNEKTGVLLSPDATPPEVAAALQKALEPGRLAVTAVRAFFQQRFDATANYNSFVDALLALHEGMVPAGRP